MILYCLVDSVEGHEELDWFLNWLAEAEGDILTSEDLVLRVN